MLGKTTVNLMKCRILRHTVVEKGWTVTIVEGMVIGPVIVTDQLKEKMQVKGIFMVMKTRCLSHLTSLVKDHIQICVIDLEKDKTHIYRRSKL